MMHVRDNSRPEGVDQPLSAGSSIKARCALRINLLESISVDLAFRRLDLPSLGAVMMGVRGMQGLLCKWFLLNLILLIHLPDLGSGGGITPVHHLESRL